MGLNIEQISVRRGQAKAKAGTVASDPSATIESSAPHTAGRVAAVVTYTVVAALGVGTVHTISVEGEEVSYTEIALDTTTLIAAGLEAAMLANFVINGMVTPVAAVADIVITHKTLNYTLEVAAIPPSQGTIVNTTPAAGASTIPFGIAVYDDGAGNVTDVNPGADLSALAGISKSVYSEEEAGYPDTSRVNIVETGFVYVESDDSEVKGDQLWIGQDANERGKFFTADNLGTTRLQLTTGGWRRAGVISINQTL